MCRVEVKEDKKLDKYQDFARELKKLWCMKMIVIPIVVDAFETVSKNPEKRLDELEIRGRIEFIMATAPLKLGRILRKVLGA